MSFVHLLLHIYNILYNITNIHITFSIILHHAGHTNSFQNSQSMAATAAAGPWTRQIRWAARTCSGSGALPRRRLRPRRADRSPRWSTHRWCRSRRSSPAALRLAAWLGLVSFQYLSIVIFAWLVGQFIFFCLFKRLVGLVWSEL